MRTYLAAALVVCAACPRVDLDGLRYGTDAAVAEDASAEDDAGDVGPRYPEDPAMRCIEGHESWWCYAGTELELELYAAEHDAQIIDLEVEAGVAERRWAAVMIRNDGLYRRVLFRMMREGPNGALDFPELFEGAIPVALEPYDVEDGTSNRAAVLLAKAYNNAVFVLFTEPTEYDLRQVIDSHPGYRQVIDLDRQYWEGEERFLYVGVPGEVSTLAVDVSGGVLRSYEEDGAHFVRTFAVRPGGVYDATIGTLEPGQLPSHFVHGLTEEQLIEETHTQNAHVTNLDIFRVRSERRFSALLTGNSELGAERRRDSAAFAHLLAEGTANATVAVYAKHAGASTDLFFNERRGFASENLMAVAMAVYVYNIDAFDDSQLIGVPAIGCGTSTAGSNATIAETFDRMFFDRDARAATALVDHFGLAAFQELLPRLSMRSSVFLGPPGCEAVFGASATTLLDQALLFEHGVERGIRAAVRAAAIARLPGYTLAHDPDGVRALLEEVLDQAADAEGYTAAHKAGLKARANVTSMSSDLGDPRPSIAQRAIVGRLVIPHCAPALETELAYFGFLIEGRADSAAVEAAIRRGLRALFERYFVPAVARGQSCY